MRVRAREQARKAAMEDRWDEGGGGDGGHSGNAAPDEPELRECTSVEDALEGTGRGGAIGHGGADGEGGGNGGRLAEVRADWVVTRSRAADPGGAAMELD